MSGRRLGSLRTMAAMRIFIRTRGDYDEALQRLAARNHRTVQEQSAYYVDHSVEAELAADRQLASELSLEAEAAA